jgi:DNA-directed RNA polymerase specialized sigma24 family protein
VKSPDLPDPQSLPLHSTEWWAAIYELHATAAWRGAMSVFNGDDHQLRDSRDVQDVVHEVFLEMMETNEIDNNTTNVAGALYKRARLRAFDRTKRGRRTELGDPEDQGERDDGFDDVDDADLAERIGGHAWDNRHLLNPTERKVWSLAQNPDLSQAEIAALAGISEGHLSTVLNKDIPRKLLRGFRY